MRQLLIRLCILAAGGIGHALAGPPGDYYCHSDDLHSVMVATDAGGAAVERYEYADFGQPLDPLTLAPAGPSGLNAPQFTGRQRDDETGWHHLRTRYLDSEAGRFTTRDIIGAWGDGRALGNASNYAAGAPGCCVDPLGTEVIKGESKKYFTLRDSIRKLAEATRDAELRKILTQLEQAQGKPAPDFDALGKAVELLSQLESEYRAELYTIDGVAHIAQFAEHAKQHGECSLSIYIGHGVGREKAHERTVEEVKKALGEARGGDKPETAPRVALYSCFAGTYNDAVHARNRIGTPPGWAGTSIPIEIAAALMKGVPPELERLKKACGKKLSVHVYYGEDGERPAPEPKPK